MMKKNTDERIVRESNALAANAFWLLLILQAGVLAVKLLASADIRVCVLDMAVLAVGGVGMVVLRSVKGLWGAKDDVLREIEQAGLAKLFLAMFWMLIVGEFLLIFMDEANIWWYAPYLLIWGIPSLLLTIQSTRRGLMVWGGKKAEADGKARLLKGTIAGAAFFGIIMGGSACFKDGAFQLSGLWKVISMSASWGLLFYWMMRLLVNRSEKTADKAVETAEANAGEE